MRSARALGLTLLAATLTVLPTSSARADHEPPAVDVVVDTFADSYDGSCADGDCSLRDAVASAAEGDVIGLPSGVFRLTLPGGGPDGGDIDVTTSVGITGIGETGTFVVASSLGDRAFDLAGADVTFERLTILGGSTAGRGGAIRVTGGGAHLDLVSVRDSHARNGGAIGATDADVRIDRSALIDDVADRRGGAVSSHGSAVVRIARSSIVGAIAGSGGAVWTGSSGSLTVTTSTMVGNEANVGGALRAIDGTPWIRRTTIARNTASRAAAVATKVEIDISLSVVAANRSARGRPCVGAFGAVRLNVGTRGTQACGFDPASNAIVRDARLGPLASHGGPTPTIALRPDAPAIDVDPDCSRADQRGVRHKGPCDAGAYEFTRCQDVVVNVVGTRHGDELSGGRRADGLLGRAGPDELQGSLDRDGVCGGLGDDRLLGGPGDDRVDGSHGDDRLHGEDGDDVLRGGGGRDIVIGGPGRDMCVVDRMDRVRSCERVR